MYKEKFRATVNDEGNLQEVILRGTDSTHTLILRFEGKEKSGFEAGAVYNIHATRSHEDEVVVPVDAPLAVTPPTVEQGKPYVVGERKPELLVPKKKK